MNDQGCYTPKSLSRGLKFNPKPPFAAIQLGNASLLENSCGLAVVRFMRNAEDATLSYCWDRNPWNAHLQKIEDYYRRLF